MDEARQIPAAFLQNPLFVLRNAHRMFAHTYRGSTQQIAFGRGEQRKSFARYGTHRAAERAYL